MIATLLMASAAFPVLLRVAVWAALVVPAVAVKVSEPGTSVTTGAGAADSRAGERYGMRRPRRIVRHG